MHNSVNQRPKNGGQIMNLKKTVALEFFEHLFRYLANTDMHSSRPTYPVNASKGAVCSVQTLAR